LRALRRERVNLTALIVVNLLWAAQYPAYKIAGDSIEPAALNFWTLICASVLLIPLRMRERNGHTQKKGAVAWKPVGEYSLLGVLGIVPPSVMLAWGIAHSSAANAAILSLTIPILMTLLGVLMLGEKLTLVRMLCLSLGCAGTLLISIGDLERLSLSRSLLVGNVAILLGGLGSAFYNTYSKDLLSRYSEVQVLLYSYVVAALACAFISAGFDSRPFYVLTGYAATTWLAILSLGLLPWGLAMVLWMWVLNRLEVGQASASIYLLPMFGLLLSVITVHDHVALPQIVGGALTVIGTAMLTLYEGKRPAREPASS
jgi:drug/metabolite transporter (DMT)-like permease